MVVSGDDDLRDPAARTARIPSLALRTAREALLQGPVLVQVPRAGYVPSTSCQDCRTPARCTTCHGPLQLTGSTSAARCGWCARSAVDWRCPECGSARLRSVRVGVRRTAEEIGRALAGVPVRTSSTGSGVLARVGPEPAVVLATPGAEPVAEGGYAAAVLLDAWVLLSRPDLRASEEALRRWLVAVGLVRPASAGGRVVVVGDAGLAPVQALVRLDPAGYAARELAERVALGLPPAGLLAQVTGPPDGLTAFAAALRLPAGAELLGPAPLEVGGREIGTDLHRLLVRAAPTGEAEVVHALAAARGVLSAAKEAHPPRVAVRPAEVG